MAIADTFTYAEAVTQAQANHNTNTAQQPEQMDQVAASASTDQAAATEATPKRVNGGKKRKAKHEALQPLNNINPSMAPEPRGEQTTNMGLDHDKAQAQFYKEAFATALAATEALKTQVQTFNETSALA